MIKSFLIPKFVYACSVLPTPKELIKPLNKLLFKFLWKGTDKVKRVSVINEYDHEEGGLRMIDLECMVKSIRLAWLRRIFNGMNGPRKSVLQHLLGPFGGFFFCFFFLFVFFACNYNISDLTIPSQFYYELLSWWSEFGQTFATEKDWTNIIWNNCEIRIDSKPVHYKNYYEAGIVFSQDLLFNYKIKRDLA